MKQQEMTESSYIISATRHRVDSNTSLIDLFIPVLALFLEVDSWSQGI